eukprot:TRINITY_DN25484_c0_g1_i5.p1 TRINITY_DN25484_c0_g1~~TRINITY_DN25484_c0_g1_i5.p1  ORF type:complete len:449 (+),score=69.24 TRINITY_DN25484_c0_g1_i5:65-1411(+)
MAARGGGWGRAAPQVIGGRGDGGFGFRGRGDGSYGRGRGDGGYVGRGGGDGGSPRGRGGKGKGKGGSGRGGGVSGSDGARGRDKSDFFSFHEGLVLSGGGRRYHVRSRLGDGSFGRVLLAEEEGSKARWALKIMAPHQTYNQYVCDAKQEAAIFERLSAAEGFKESGCLSMQEWFNCTESWNTVIVPSSTSYGFDVAVIQTMARQMLEQLAHMHRCQFIHTDVKHKNVMFTDGSYYRVPGSAAWPPHVEKRGQDYLHPASPVVRIIDYGSGVFPGDHKTHPIHTKQFRAPEVSLRAGEWDIPSDLWTLGCVLVWMYTGRLLFNSHQPAEQLAMQEAALGPVPQGLLRRAEAGMSKLFDTSCTDAEAARRGGRLLRPPRLRAEWSRPLVELFLDAPGHRELRDLCSSLLCYTPEDRISAEDALAHAFFRLSVEPAVSIPATARPTAWHQ